jgi:hypothetical protein
VVEELAGGGLEVVVVSSLQPPRIMLVASNKINESRNIFFNLFPSSFLTFFLTCSGFCLLLPPYPFKMDKGEIKLGRRPLPRSFQSVMFNIFYVFQIVNLFNFVNL